MDRSTITKLKLTGAGMDLRSCITAHWLCMEVFITTFTCDSTVL